MRHRRERPTRSRCSLCEEAETVAEPPKIHVFATDIDESAIAQAARGCSRVDRDRRVAGGCAGSSTAKANSTGIARSAREG
jgi:hypothetical protein